MNNNSSIIKRGIKTLKKIKVPGHSDIYLYKVIEVLINQIKQFGIAERASIVSFNLIMAIPPLLMFILSVTPYLPYISSKFERETLLIIKALSPDHLTYLNLKFIIKDLFSKPKSTIYSSSFFLIMYFASNAILVMKKNFDKSIENKRQIHWIIKRIKAIVITLVIIIAFILLISLISFEKYLIESIKKSLHLKSFNIKSTIIVLRFTMLGMFIFFIIAFIYKFSPSSRKKSRFFSTGAILASIIYVIVSYVFNYWTTNYMLYTQRYGPLGTMIMVLTLIYIFSFILLVGFELNQSIEINKEQLKNKNK